MRRPKGAPNGKATPMNKFTAISIIALLIVVAALPVYALYESGRMDRAQANLTERYVAEGANMYVENCATCHGADGTGIGAMPALNNPGLAKADHQVLYDTIAHSPHGTVMSAWHVDEGGALNSFQVEGLVTLIMSADWTEVSRMALANGFEEPARADPMAQLARMEADAQDDPHECRACHEEPDVHAERFGFNCSRCHTLEAWKPALLLRHAFALDHGDEGKVACQTCHTTTYFENTCYECHDHDPGEMETVHAAEGITQLDPCHECHPTGASGEAERLGYGLGGQTSGLPAPGLKLDGQLRGGGTIEIPPLGEENANQPGRVEPAESPAGERDQEPARPGGLGNGAPAPGPSRGG
jgi:mono/diheme cytochrome c family protein